MMKKRYRFSNGLAFAEEKDLKMLHEKAMKGWKVASFKGGIYSFEKSTPENVIFTFDYHELEEEDEEEYFGLFEGAGWTHITTHAGFHLFKAAPGTTPIYSDSASMADRAKRSAKPVLFLAVIALLLTLAAAAFMNWGTGSLQQAGLIVFIISFALLVPMIMTSMAIFLQFYKAKMKTRK
jgi:hypothetical protein